jgi:TolB protein
MNADGTNAVRLTTNDKWLDVFPDWSPDGTRIVFSSTRLGGVMQIFVMNADGSDQRPLTTAGPNWYPRWSPDGRKISFMSLRGDRGTGMGSGNGIYVINPDGTGEMNLTQSPAMDMFSTWSSDGHQIYFCNTRFTAMGISVFNLADGTVRNLTDPRHYEAMPHARWPRRIGISGSGM